MTRKKIEKGRILYNIKRLNGPQQKKFARKNNQIKAIFYTDPIRRKTTKILSKKKMKNNITFQRTFLVSHHPH